ncbi:MAG: hypothetical protein JSS53_05770 [Proteobacteria bacterium]|nr:hypothetical protein [Pseudomonadota bacterium]
MKKDGKVEYKKCEISYSVYGENGQYSAFGHLIVHAESVFEHPIISDQIYNSSAEAEKHIIEKAKSYLDHLIDSGKYKPIK